MSHGCLIALGSWEFGGQFGGHEILVCWALCAVGWGALDFFSNQCCVGFSAGSDQTGWLLVPAGMVEPWMPLILPSVFWCKVSIKCCSVHLSVLLMLWLVKVSFMGVFLHLVGTVSSTNEGPLGSNHNTQCMLGRGTADKRVNVIAQACFKVYNHNLIKKNYLMCL